MPASLVLRPIFEISGPPAGNGGRAAPCFPGTVHPEANACGQAEALAQAFFVHSEAALIRYQRGVAFLNNT